MAGKKPKHAEYYLIKLLFMKPKMEVQ